MKVYDVVYRTSDYYDKDYSVVVVARSVLQAAQVVTTKKYISYSGRVLSVVERIANCVVAK